MTLLEDIQAALDSGDVLGEAIRRYAQELVDRRVAEQELMVAKFIVENPDIRAQDILLTVQHCGSTTRFLVSQKEAAE